MWKEYKKKCMLEKIELAVDVMMKDSNILNKADLVEMYGNPSKWFVDLKWAYHCVRKGKDDKRAKQTCDKILGRTNN